MRYTYEAAHQFNEGEFQKAFGKTLLEVFDLRTSINRNHFQTILQNCFDNKGLSNKTELDIVIQKLSNNNDFDNVEKLYTDLYSVIRVGHLLDDRQTKSLLHCLSRMAGSSSTIIGTFLQESNFFNNAGIISNLVHLFRKHQGESLQNMTFLSYILKILSCYSKSRKAGKESTRSCIYLLRDIFQQHVKDKAFHEDLDKIEATLDENEKTLRYVEELERVTNYEILPTLEMIQTNAGPIISPRQRGAPFESDAQYLAYYFNIFVEDFIGPLRSGINRYVDYAQERNIKYKFRDEDVRLYEGVSVVRQKCLPEAGIVWEIQFDASSFRKLRWETCDFLKFGNLVCLMYNACQEIVYGLVADRNVPDLKNGITIISILSERSDLFDVFSEISDGKLAMIESRCFYTAYKHTLQEMQNSAQRMLNDRHETIPLAKIIAEQQIDDTPPLYMLAKNGLSKWLDFSCMVQYGPERAGDKPSKVQRLIPVHAELHRPSDDEEETERIPRTRLGSKYPVLDAASCPTAADMGLDTTQYDAFRHCLTSKLAIVQGPPGTGKTLLGLRLAEFFLNNFKELQTQIRDVPIVLLSYTNHALDQFLEAIIQSPSLQRLFKGGHCPFLRIGPRCESDIVRPSMLPEQKRQRKIFCSKNQRRELSNLASGIDRVNYQKELLDCGIIHPLCLHDIHAMPYEIYRQLAFGNTILDWLGIFDSKFQRYMIGNVHGKNTEEGRGQNENNEEIYTDMYKEEIERRMIMDNIAECDSDDEGNAKQTSTFNVEMALSKNWLDKFIHELGLNKGIFKCIENKLHQSQAVSSDEANYTGNVFSLGHKNRWRLYKYWHSICKDRLLKNLTFSTKEFQKLNEQYKKTLDEELLHVMSNSKLVAMTTTGAAKHMKTLRKIAPKIIIVEEAAQVSEQHIIGCLHKDVQHLILIGDHQQLKPTVNNFALSRIHGTDVSMMERLANSGVPFRRLSHQHRMRLEISNLLKTTIYKDLFDHKSVQSYESVKGMAQDVVLFDHQHDESKRGNFTTSYKNEFEANMLVDLYKHLRLQGYESKDITILSAYNEQVRHIRSLVKPVEQYLRERGCDKEDNNRGIQIQLKIKDKEMLRPFQPKGVRVTAVDNFQGEENNIILLSLVRSNNEKRIGYLKDEKRICVSLSRAKKGLYVVGNFQMLGKKNNCWAKILEIADGQSQLKRCFPLKCQNHPDSIMEIKSPEDFETLAPDGGCAKQCETQLRCGHVCDRKCHNDRFVHELPCMKECARKCVTGHLCKKRCCDPCGECKEPVMKTIPDCGHSQEMACYKNPQNFVCQEKC